MKKIAIFINKHFPKLAEEIYYIIERERYNPEPEEYSDDELITWTGEDLPF